MLLEVLARMERAKLRLQEIVDYVLREGEDPLRELRDRSLEEMLREPGYVELRRSRDWDPGNWR